MSSHLFALNTNIFIVSVQVIPKICHPIRRAAIELNYRPQVWLPANDDIPLQRAVIAAAMVLGLFWDPAESLL